MFYLFLHGTVGENICPILWVINFTLHWDEQTPYWWFSHKRMQKSIHSVLSCRNSTREVVFRRPHMTTQEFSATNTCVGPTCVHKWCRKDFFLKSVQKNVRVAYVSKFIYSPNEIWPLTSLIFGFWQNINRFLRNLLQKFTITCQNLNW